MNEMKFSGSSEPLPEELSPVSPEPNETSESQKTVHESKTQTPDVLFFQENTDPPAPQPIPSDAAFSSEHHAAEKNAEKEDGAEYFSPVGNLFDWIKSFLFSLTVVIFVFTLLFRGVTVVGDSMLPTFHSGEYLVISNLFYAPETGDVVVVQSPHYRNGTEPLIKRVIATGGQTVKINFNTWQVFVDGELLQEAYISYDPYLSMNCEDLTPDENGVFELTVEENCIFVMGDNRNDSLDSRSNAVGQIDERYIMGRVIYRLLPLSRFGKVE